MIMLAPTAPATNRGEMPLSIAVPDSQAETAITAMAIPKSAAKTLPR
jgi:hypothetical protein